MDRRLPFWTLSIGSIHAPRQLQTWLDAQALAYGWPFTVQVDWLPTRACWLDQIEIWLGVLQRKLLHAEPLCSSRSVI